MTRATTPVHAQCNTCGRLSPEGASTIKKARALAKLEGWTYSGDTDTCDECRPGYRKAKEVSFWRDLVVHFLRGSAHLTYAQIGLITGISRQRIHQILKGTTIHGQWIKTSEEYFAEITQPRSQELEEFAEADHKEGMG